MYFLSSSIRGLEELNFLTIGTQIAIKKIRL